MDADVRAETVTVTNPAFLVQGAQVDVSCFINNTSPLAVEIVRLWVQDTATCNITNEELSVSLQPGDSQSFATAVDVSGAAQSHAFNLWFVTARGNLLSPYPNTAMLQAEAQETGSIRMDWMEFRFYDFGADAPSAGTELPAPQSGCDIPQDRCVMIGAMFTNLDPAGRTITLTPESYVWAITPR